MTYEYICAACGNEWEAEQPITAAPLKDCPACGKPEARRQISGGSGFVLKGGGWYADGYGSKPAAKKSESASAGDSSSSSSPSSSDSASSSSSKPAADKKPAAQPVSKE